MSRNEDLPAPSSVCAELLGEFRKKRMVKLVLGLLDAQQRMWLRIEQQHQVSEHLDGSVRDVARQERILEGAVLKL